MVSCAAFGCNNRGTKGKGLSFFSFPKDGQLRKAWIHYCRRWNFDPTSGHRLCSAHFTRDCFERDPFRMMELGFDGTFKRRLKPDVTPNVPLASPDSEKKDGETPVLHIPRRALQKRQKAEILQSAFEDYNRSTAEEHQPQPDTPVVTEPSDPVAVEPSVKPEVRMVNKKLQVDIKPQQRTRSHQTDAKITQTPKTYATIATQTESVSSLQQEKVHTDDPSLSDEDDGPHNNDDDEYTPEDEEGSSSDDDTDAEEAEAMNYKLNPGGPPDEEHQFIVSESALTELLSVCRFCCSEATSYIQFTKGTMIATNTVCVNGHISIWKSQSCHKGLPWSNLMTATAIMCSGCNATKALQMFQNMNIQMFSNRTLTRLQSLYVTPSATNTWDSEQASHLQEINGQDVVVGGDARCDSPGYSAKYGAYTLMDLLSKKILDFQLVQSNEVQGSTHMELEGLKRGIAFLKNHVNIKEVVTDRHPSIKKYMRTEQEDKSHLFDVWHVAKGISKKLEAEAKKKGGKDIRPWIKSVVNHIYWISSSCGNDGELKAAKWLSIVNHISNTHEGHSPAYPKCDHGDIQQERQWIKEGSVPYKLLKNIIENKRLLPDIPKLSPVYQTYSLEVFHSVVNHFAPKSTHFFYPAMLARLGIAALHYNENCNRGQAITKDGQQCFNTCYPKAKKGTHAVVKPRRTPPTFVYVALIKQAVVERRRSECSTHSNALDDVKVLNTTNPPSLTSSFIVFEKADLIQRHRSRFSRQ